MQVACGDILLAFRNPLRKAPQGLPPIHTRGGVPRVAPPKADQSGKPPGVKPAPAKNSANKVETREHNP